MSDATAVRLPTVLDKKVPEYFQAICPKKMVAVIKGSKGLDRESVSQMETTITYSAARLASLVIVQLREMCDTRS